MTDATSESPVRSRPPWFRPVLKWTLFALVLSFVVHRAAQMWQADGASLAEVRIDCQWLPAAGAAYLAGWLPSVWFWKRLMHRTGGELRFRDAARAYYCGHLGKYVPGKAAVVVIRAALMKGRGYRAAPAALTVVYESLVMIGAGLAVAAALGPLLLSEAGTAALPGWLRGFAKHPLLPAMAVIAACGLLLPMLSLVFTRVALRMTPADLLQSHGPAKIDSPLLGGGLAAFAVAWALHGLSLGLTLRAVSEGPFDLSDWPLWTGAVALATTIGFAAIFAPGGLGVREGLLIGVLQPQVGAHQAIAAAILLRAVWFAAEVVAAAALYMCVRPQVEAGKSITAATNASQAAESEAMRCSVP